MNYMFTRAPTECKCVFCINGYLICILTSLSDEREKVVVTTLMLSFFRSQTNALWRVAMTEPFVSGTSSKPNELCVINDCCYRPTNAISDHVTRGRPDTWSMETPALFSCIVIILTLNWTVIPRSISISFCFVLFINLFMCHFEFKF